MCRRPRLVLLRFPGRVLVFAGDSGLGTHEAARFCHRPRPTLVSRCHPGIHRFGLPPPYACPSPAGEGQAGAASPSAGGDGPPPADGDAVRGRDAADRSRDRGRALGQGRGRAGPGPVGVCEGRDRPPPGAGAGSPPTPGGRRAPWPAPAPAGGTSSRRSRRPGRPAGWRRPVGGAGTRSCGRPRARSGGTPWSPSGPTPGRHRSVLGPGKATVTLSDARSAVRRRPWAETALPPAGDGTALQKLPGFVRELLLTTRAPAT